MAIAKGNLRAEALLSGEDSGARYEPARQLAAAPRRGAQQSTTSWQGRDGQPGRRPGAAEELAAADKTLSVVGPFDATRFAGAARTAGVPVAKRA